MDPDSLAFTLVSNYLIKNGYEKVAKQLQKEVICEKVDLEVIQDCFSFDMHHSGHFLVP